MMMYHVKQHLHICTHQTMIGCQGRVIKSPVVQIIICSIEVPCLEKAKKLLGHINIRHCLYKWNTVAFNFYKNKQKREFHQCWYTGQWRRNERLTIREQADCKLLLASVSVLHSPRTLAVYQHLFH